MSILGSNSPIFSTLARSTNDVRAPRLSLAVESWTIRTLPVGKVRVGGYWLGTLLPQEIPPLV